MPPNWQVVPEGTIFSTAIIGGMIAGITIAIFWMVSEFLTNYYREWKEEHKNDPIEDATADPEVEEEIFQWTPKVDPYWIAQDVKQYLTTKEIIDDAREYIARHVAQS